MLEGFRRALNEVKPAKYAHHADPDASQIQAGIFAAVALDGPRGQMKFDGPTRDLLAVQGLAYRLADLLAPAFVRHFQSLSADQQASLALRF